MSEPTALGGGTSGTTSTGAPPPAATTPATTAAPTTTAATGGTGTTTWRDSLSEEIRANPAISMYSDVESLVKSHIHAQSQIGKKGAIVPGEKATPAEWDSFYKAIGVPPADKYDIKAPEGIDTSVVNGFKAEAAKNGILPKQAEALLNWYHGFDQNADKLAEAENKKTVQTNIEGLKKEWGDGFDKEIKSAQYAVKEFGGEDLIKVLNETGLGNEPAVIKAFAKAAKLFGEDKLREGGVSDGRMTSGEIQSQIDEIRAKGFENGFFDKKHPMHDITLKKFESLAKQLTGGR